MFYILLFEKKEKRKKREKQPGGFFPGQAYPSLSSIFLTASIF
jgi:hypothetical protein